MYTKMNLTDWLVIQKEYHYFTYNICKYLKYNYIYIYIYKVILQFILHAHTRAHTRIHISLFIYK